MALACEPELLIADEPTTALDVTTQAQILELIGSIQQRMNLAVLLITHDLGVVAALCHRVEVMYAGQLMERGGVRELFATPGHPYTAGLLRATPRPDEKVEVLWSIDGTPPDPRNPPPGCPFNPRCELAIDRCRTERPPMVEHAPGRTLACWRPFEASREIPAPVTLADVP
jgi:oligopeptide/dipeptide ABC transporter ATP-binding protein